MVASGSAAESCGAVVSSALLFCCAASAAAFSAAALAAAMAANSALDLRPLCLGKAASGSTTTVGSAAGALSALAAGAS